MTDRDWEICHSPRAHTHQHVLMQRQQNRGDFPIARVRQHQIILRTRYLGESGRDLLFVFCLISSLSSPLFLLGLCALVVARSLRFVWRREVNSRLKSEYNNVRVTQTHTRRIGTQHARHEELLYAAGAVPSSVRSVRRSSWSFSSRDFHGDGAANVALSLW